MTRITALYKKTSVRSWPYLAHLFLVWKMFETEVVEKIKTHFMSSNFFSPENLALYEIIWKHVVNPDRPQMTIWNMRIACWMHKATDTCLEYVIPTAFSTARTRLVIMFETYIACLVWLLADPTSQWSITNWAIVDRCNVQKNKNIQTKGYNLMTEQIRVQTRKLYTYLTGAKESFSAKCT